MPFVVRFLNCFAVGGLARNAQRKAFLAIFLDVSNYCDYRVWAVERLSDHIQNTFHEVRPLLLDSFLAVVFGVRRAMKPCHHECVALDEL